ncbi:MAG: efflux RND transporter periplasmic adaptor subunit [Haliea sp.]
MTQLRKCGLPAVALLLLLPALCWADTGVVVETARVERIALGASLPLNGSVFSRNDVAVTAAVAGELDWVAEPGTGVGKGEPIARLDRAPLQLRREELQGLLDREAVNEAYQNKVVERYLALSESQNLSVFLLDEAMSRRDIARKDMAILEARIRQMDDEIARSEVRARFNGVLVQRSKQGGEFVVPGEMIGRFVDLDRLEVRVAVPISYRTRLAVGDRLAIAGGEGSHVGVVRTLIGTGDPVSQTFELHVDLVESERELVMPGQLVKVEIPLEASQMTLAVPRDAVVIRSEGSYIYRVSAEGVAERVPVAVGAGQAHLVAVSGELEEGQRIVVRGGDRLREGQKVSEQGQEAPVNLQS